MAKSLKKYKKPPRTAREVAEEPPAQKKAMDALGIPPKMPPVKKVARKAAPKKQVISDTESEARVDSGTEEGGVHLSLPVSLLPTLTW